jgi:hypothetical protein
MFEDYTHINLNTLAVGGQHLSKISFISTGFESQHPISYYRKHNYTKISSSRRRGAVLVVSEKKL